MMQPGSYLVGLALIFTSGGALCAQDNDVPRLIEKLVKEEKPGGRKAAARSLGDLGPKAKQAVPALITALNDTDGGVRDAAEEALKKIGEPAVSQLVEGMKDPDQFVRLRIVGILGGIGPDAKAALPALEAATKDASSFVSEAAKEAVVRVQLDPKALIPMFKDKDEEKRLYAVRASAFLGPRAKAVIPNLCDTLKQDRSKEVRREVPNTLAKLGKDGTAGIPALIAALNDSDETIKLNTIKALAEMGADAKVALPALDRVARAAKTSKNEAVLEAATSAWLKISAKRP